MLNTAINLEDSIGSVYSSFEMAGIDPSLVVINISLMAYNRTQAMSIVDDITTTGAADEIQAGKFMCLATKIQSGDLRVFYPLDQDNT